MRRKKLPHWPSYARSLKRTAKKITGPAKNFEPLIIKASDIAEPYYKAQALSWIARRMADVNLKSSNIFSMALEAAEEVPQEWRRAEILEHIIIEMSKAGEKDYSKPIDKILTINDPKQKQKILKTISRRLTLLGIKIPDISNKIKENYSEDSFKKSKDLIYYPKTGKAKKITLALFNTYKGKKLRDPLIRAIARAAPVCYAFDLNLCLIGFPASNTGEVISIVEAESKIGEGESFIRRLKEEGRLFIIKDLKSIPPHLGEIVATTSNPDQKKSTSLTEIVQDNNVLCILIGLGGQGLPKHILASARRHLEITGKGVPLETCTAIGAIGALLSRR
jgi:hypothetical protein